eukprot:INCI9121.1.p2 GENE.INCI9121.1~~INCI9121.1.p2  ORF type:complete len:105 (-),score=14.88 INCI9121.1:44-358(-)
MAQLTPVNPAKQLQSPVSWSQSPRLEQAWKSKSAFLDPSPMKDLRTPSKPVSQVRYEVRSLTTTSGSSISFVQVEQCSTVKPPAPENSEARPLSSTKSPGNWFE